MDFGHIHKHREYFCLYRQRRSQETQTASDWPRCGGSGCTEGNATRVATLISSGGHGRPAETCSEVSGTRAHAHTHEHARAHARAHAHTHTHTHAHTHAHAKTYA